MSEFAMASTPMRSGTRAYQQPPVHTCKVGANWVTDHLKSVRLELELTIKVCSLLSQFLFLFERIRIEVLSC